MSYREVLHRNIDRRQLLAGAAALLLVGCGADGEAHPGDEDAPISEPAAAPGLITPTALRAMIDDPDLRLIDLSELRDYRHGHIPGAQHCWWQDMIEVHNPIYGMLLNTEGRAELTRKLGITPTSEVVCYDRSGGVYASRLLWMLEYMGFTTGRLLTGGLDGWRLTGGEIVSKDPADPPPGDIEDIQNEFINAHADDIIARQGEAGLVILDTRTEDERKETWHGKLRTGQIPDSLWLPRDQLLAEGDVPWVLPAEQLRSVLTDAGIEIAATAEVIVYGLHATLACLPYVALKSLAEFHVRLYDGAWAEWGGQPERPVEPLN